MATPPAQGPGDPEPVKASPPEAHRSLPRLCTLCVKSTRRDLTSPLGLTQSKLRFPSQFPSLPYRLPEWELPWPVFSAFTVNLSSRVIGGPLTRFPWLVVTLRSASSLSSSSSNSVCSISDDFLQRNRPGPVYSRRVGHRRCLPSLTLFHSR